MDRVHRAPQARDTPALRHCPSKKSAASLKCQAGHLAHPPPPGPVIISAGLGTTDEVVVTGGVSHDPFGLMIVIWAVSGQCHFSHTGISSTTVLMLRIAGTR